MNDDQDWMYLSSITRRLETLEFLNAKTATHDRQTRLGLDAEIARMRDARQATVARIAARAGLAVSSDSSRASANFASCA